MQAYEFDYCDTYESYGSGVRLENNGLRMFTCDECKWEKTVVKKSVNDSKFRCETCIQNQIQNEVQAQMPNSLILEMPTTETTVDTTPQFSWRWLQFFT
jgi:uncharacterized protein YlaI